MQIVVPKGRIDRNHLLAPDPGLRIPNLPVVRVVTVVDNVPGEANERGICLRDRLHQSPSYARIGSLGVVWIVKPCVTVNHETEWSFQVQREVRRRSLSMGLLRATGH